MTFEYCLIQSEAPLFLIQGSHIILAPVYK